MSGDLDLDGVASVRAALLDAVGSGPLAVDLHDVGYVSSAGVALLVELSMRARAPGDVAHAAGHRGVAGGAGA